MPKSKQNEPPLVRLLRSLFINTASEILSLILRLYLLEARLAERAQSSSADSPLLVRRRTVASDDEQEELEEAEVRSD